MEYTAAAGAIADPNYKKRGDAAMTAPVGGSANIAIIDIAHLTDPLQNPSPANDRVIQQVIDACEDTGFLLIKGHGIPRDLRERTMAELRAFMQQPASVKEKVRSAFQPRGTRGYYRMGDAMSVQRFYFGHPINDETNIWPNEEARKVFSTYFLAVERLRHVLMSIFDKALGLDDGTCEAALDNRDGMAIFNYYPGSDDSNTEAEKTQANTSGLVGHTDWGPLAIVVNTGPGLQVLQNDEWRPVVTPEGEDLYQINLGDLLSRLTNGKWKSTLHRVRNTGAERISLVMQTAETMLTPEERAAREEEVIKPLPGCEPAPGEAPLWEPISLDSLMELNFNLLKRFVGDDSYEDVHSGKNYSFVGDSD